MMKCTQACPEVIYITLRFDKALEMTNIQLMKEIFHGQNFDNEKASLKLRTLIVAGLLGF
jgi:hypothetical protein